MRPSEDFELLYLAAEALTHGARADHFFLDNFVAFYSTAIQTGLLNLDAFWHRCSLLIRSGSHLLRQY